MGLSVLDASDESNASNESDASDESVSVACGQPRPFCPLCVYSIVTTTIAYLSQKSGLTRLVAKALQVQW